MRLGTAICGFGHRLCSVHCPGGGAKVRVRRNPNALGLARTVEVDTTGGPGFGFEQYKAHDFLLLKEVVLTFDDGPWPGNTTRGAGRAGAPLHQGDVLPGRQACPVASGDPQAGRRRRPHHRRPHLVACQPRRCERAPAAKRAKGAAEPQNLHARQAIEEIEKGFSAVKLALGGPPAPFFRFPFLKDPKDQLDYLGTRNIAVFSHDLDSFDFKMRKPEDVIKSVMSKLEKKGKGIILMHDFQQATAKAVPDLLNELKAKGYKVVHMKAKTPLATIAKWDEAAKSEIKGVIGGDRPTSSVVRTIDEAPASAPAATAATQTAPAKK